MKKKRIKADNVEQLIEIIRSLKDEENGEEKNQDRFGYSKTPAEGERVEESSSPKSRIPCKLQRLKQSPPESIPEGSIHTEADLRFLRNWRTGMTTTFLKNIWRRMSSALS